MGKYGFDAADKMVDERGTGEGGLFLKLPADGDKCEVVFCGEPYSREEVWVDGKPYEYDPKNPDHQGEKPRMRFYINLLDMTAKPPKMMLWGGSFFWYRDLKACHQKYGLKGWSFEMTRLGEGKSTTYKIMPERQLSEKQQAWVQQQEMHDIEKLLSGAVEESKETYDPGSFSNGELDDDSIPF